MAFCRNCGSEISEGTKFCPNCGTSVEINISESIQSEANEDTANIYDVHADFSDAPADENVQLDNEPISTLDKFGKFYGIILMILSFVDLQSDPAFLTIILSVAIIAGCIFCFGKKYKLKGFTIVALIIAVFCLLSGINQGKKIGYFKIPGSTKVVETTHETSPEAENITKDATAENDKDNSMAENNADAKNDEAAATTETTSAEEEELAEEKQPAENEKLAEDNQSAEDVTTSEEKETVNGVDPDLKAFLDSYEEFMDEYVDFMKKYMDDPGNAISMLSEYTKIMEKYEDFAEKIDKYDSDEMSKEDAKYYLEVINRCNQKMLDLY